MIEKSKEQRFLFSMENMMLLKVFTGIWRGRILLSIWELKLGTGSEYLKWSARAQGMIRLSTKWLTKSETIMQKGWSTIKLLNSTSPPRTIEGWWNVLPVSKTMIVWLRLLRNCLKMILFWANLQIDSNSLAWLSMQSNVMKKWVNTKRQLIVVCCLIIGE